MNFGIRNKLGHFLHKLRQILLVGVTLGMMRTVVPALAESEFGVPRGSSTVLVAFMVAFGFIKCTMNFVTGSLAEHIGCRRVLLIGWLVATAIDDLRCLIWGWIVFATILLGINQGLV